MSKIVAKKPILGLEAAITAQYEGAGAKKIRAQGKNIYFDFFGGVRTLQKARRAPSRLSMICIYVFLKFKQNLDIHCQIFVQRTKLCV